MESMERLLDRVRRGAAARNVAAERGEGDAEARRETRTSIAAAIGDIGFEERIIGRDDLLPVNFLARGAAAARAVAKVDVKDMFGRALGSGTGFLVADGVLLTNHHVLPDVATSRKSLAVFNFEDDERGEPRAPAYYALDPDRVFATDAALDYTFVGVKRTGLAGTALASQGHVTLLAESGKALVGEPVNIVQHPNGAPKQVAIRANRVKRIVGSFVHYEADTNPGASGSAVTDDAWLAVALHHSGVPETDAAGKVLDARTGQPFPDQDRISWAHVTWVANEGVRISAIHEHVRTRPDLAEAMRTAVLDVFSTAAQFASDPAAGLVAAPQDAAGAEIVTRTPSDLAGRSGYDPTFLGDGLEVALPQVPCELRDDVVRLRGSREFVLDYEHFSVVMSRARRIALFTAVNIDGGASRKIPRGRDVWYLDGRIDTDAQIDNALYAGNDIDRGHLVRREDPNWGDEAQTANDDTFAFTNCSPQHKDLNQKTWLGLESYILDNARAKRIRVTVFTGPVFRDDDIEYRGVQIPAEFWKVVVTANDGALAASAYLQSQRNLLGDLEFAYGEYKTYRVPVARIESLTGLDFGTLRTHDPRSAGEAREASIGRARVSEVTTLDDIEM